MKAPQTLLITGASSGIGEALALLAAQNGWRVIACGRNETRLAQLQQKAAAFAVDGPNPITTLAFDITDLAQCQAKLKGLSPDVAVLNAGTCEYVDCQQFDSEMVKRVFDANFFGAVHCVECLLPQLRSGSQLVFVESLARLLPFTRSQAYGASKAALFYFAKSLDVDLQAQGIAVTTLAPGFVTTPLTAKNDFEMPMEISADVAAQSMLKAIEQRRASHFFPTFFSAILRFLNMLPDAWQVALCRRMKQQQAQ